MANMSRRNASLTAAVEADVRIELSQFENRNKPEPQYRSRKNMDALLDLVEDVAQSWLHAQAFLEHQYELDAMEGRCLGVFLYGPPSEVLSSPDSRLAYLV